MNSIDAILQAIFHYRSAVKRGANYAKPILQGLEIALKEVEKYQEIRTKINI